MNKKEFENCMLHRTAIIILCRFMCQYSNNIIVLAHFLSSVSPSMPESGWATWFDFGLIG